MAEAHDRRAVPRATLVDRPAARVRDGREALLLDVSRMGARIEHLDFLRPGAPCALELPPLLGSLTLPAEVVWCTVIGKKGRPDGESNLVSRSGLRFGALTVAQHAALAWLVGTNPPPDTPQHSA